VKAEKREGINDGAPQGKDAKKAPGLDSVRNAAGRLLKGRK
jgi:hypothetical protein